jgi:Family of unknown function (DUF6356)
VFSGQDCTNNRKQQISGDDIRRESGDDPCIEETAMLARLKTMFNAHPASLDESYLEHLGHAMSYAWRLFAAGFCALTHALLPFLFEKTASNLIRQMHAEMMARGANAPVEASNLHAAE